MSLNHLALLASALFVAYSYVFRRRDLDHIPTVGYSDPILSYISSIRFIFNAKEIILEGYQLYPGRFFKVAALEGWIVIMNGTHHVEEITRATEKNLDPALSTSAFLQFEYTLGRRIIENRYHNTILRTVMTRSIGPRFQEIYQAVVGAYSEGITDGGKEWVKIQAFPLQIDVISKVSARFLVGQPLCNSSEYRSICEAATLELYKGRMLRFLPKSLKPLASRMITGAHSLRARMEKLIKPILDERLEQEKLHGLEWADRPDDVITWLLDGARASNEDITVSDIVSRILFISFGAIHTSSMAATAALYQLCLNPQHAKEIREEVEAVVKDEGWTKESLAKMVKLDSYLRESQRMHFFSLVTVGRTAMSDYTFSDGLRIPKGTGICVNVYSRHRDEENYRDAYNFDGFRFVKEEEGEEAQLLVTSPSPLYSSFGHGRGACPGRFFAMAEIKIMLAHILTNYDIKLEKDEYPAKTYVETSAIVSRTAHILFRKRRV